MPLVFRAPFSPQWNGPAPPERDRGNSGDEIRGWGLRWARGSNVSPNTNPDHYLSEQAQLTDL